MISPSTNDQTLPEVNAVVTSFFICMFTKLSEVKVKIPVRAIPV